MSCEAIHSEAIDSGGIEQRTTLPSWVAKTFDGLWSKTLARSAGRPNACGVSGSRS
jgi:hypothetical protein